MEVRQDEFNGLIGNIAGGLIRDRIGGKAGDFIGGIIGGGGGKFFKDYCLSRIVVLNLRS